MQMSIILTITMLAISHLGVYSIPDIDECLDLDTYPCPNAECVNTIGSYNCSCYEGYKGEDFCLDIDECVVGPHDCHSEAACYNTEGSYYCVCNPGYSGNGTFCTDIDECSESTPSCSTLEDCENTIGSFNCHCITGYLFDGLGCEDINECTDGLNDCHTDAECLNNDGGFSCVCKNGYAGSGTDCTDIDECTDGSNDCHTDAECINNGGGFSCVCKDGYAGSGTDCTDIDECDASTHDCDDTAICRNTDGSHECDCKVSGYKWGDSTCIDINECSEGSHSCDINAECTNTVGNFTCACISGYGGDGTTCTDINECAQNTTHNCDQTAVCNNTGGSYECDCNVSGYKWGGATCIDIDECEDGSHNCDSNADCSNSAGSFDCTCHAGFGGDGVTCIKINERAILRCAGNHSELGDSFVFEYFPLPQAEHYEYKHAFSYGHAVDPKCSAPLSEAEGVIRLIIPRHTCGAKDIDSKTARVSVIVSNHRIIVTTGEIKFNLKCVFEHQNGDGWMQQVGTNVGGINEFPANAPKVNRIAEGIKMVVVEPDFDVFTPITECELDTTIQFVLSMAKSAVTKAIRVEYCIAAPSPGGKPETIMLEDGCPLDIFVGSKGFKGFQSENLYDPNTFSVSPVAKCVRHPGFNTLYVECYVTTCSDGKDPYCIGDNCENPDRTRRETRADGTKVSVLLKVVPKGTHAKKKGTISLETGAEVNWPFILSVTIGGVTLAAAVVTGIAMIWIRKRKNASRDPKSSQYTTE